MDYGLQAKVALVTGSTGGLGLASAEALAAEGAHVAICGRRADVASSHAERLGGIALGGDLTDPATPPRWVDEVLARYGRLDVLVGSTGGPPPGTALDTPAEAYDGALDLLVKPMVRLAHLAVPLMRAQGGGRIVFVTSAANREPIPTIVLSNSVRLAVQGFAKSLSRDVAADAITVNCVMPGRILTDRLRSLDNAAAAASGRTPQDVRAANEAAIPPRRYGEPREFGAVVCFLCSSAASYVNGTSIPVDGGALAGHW